MTELPCTKLHLVERLARLVRSRFGCDLSYFALNLTRPEHQSLHQQLLSDSPVRRDHRLYFAVFRNFQIVGAAEVENGHLLSQEGQAQLAELIELYLETSMALTDQLETLDQLESQLLRQSQSVETAVNVIPLWRGRQVREPSLRFRKTPRLGFSVPCLIEGQSFDEIKKLAQELHELSGRYAFVHLRDLAWESVGDLAEMGPISIFIPDVTALTPEDNFRLESYLRLKKGPESPQILAGTLISYAELISKELVAPQVLRLLAVGYLRMDRPFADYRRDGVVDFFFSSLLSDGIDNRLS